MGKKKAFVDKKKSVTYNLIYRNGEDVNGLGEPDRLLVEADRRVGIGRPDPEAAAAAAPASNPRYPAGA
jgi:hypothetical protein